MKTFVAPVWHIEISRTIYIKQQKQFFVIYYIFRKNDKESLTVFNFGILNLFTGIVLGFAPKHSNVLMPKTKDGDQKASLSLPTVRVTVLVLWS